MGPGPKKSKKWLDPGPSTANPPLWLGIMALILQLNSKYLENYWNFFSKNQNQNTKTVDVWYFSICKAFESRAVLYFK